MIRWCLYLRHLSSGAYELLRTSKDVALSSQRTLRDYTYHTTACAGYSSDVDAQLYKLANTGFCPERDKYVLIIADEVHIKEDIVYDKYTGEIDIVFILHYSFIPLDYFILLCMQERSLVSQNFVK